MLATIDLEGKTRRASYTLNLETRKIRRKFFSFISSDTPVGDTFKVRYTMEGDRNPLFQDCWLFLSGYAADISSRMLEDCPMSLLHRENINAVLEKRGRTVPINITFAGIKPFNAVVARSKHYKSARACQKAIMADMYNIPHDQIDLLPDLDLDRSAEDENNF